SPCFETQPAPPSADRERERRERGLQPGQVSPHPHRRTALVTLRGPLCQRRVLAEGASWVRLASAVQALPARVEVMRDRILRFSISPVVGLGLLCHSRIAALEDGGFAPAGGRRAQLSSLVIRLACSLDLLNNG